MDKGDPAFNIHLLGLNQAMNLSANPANGTDTVPSDFFADRDVRMAFAYTYSLQSSIDEMYRDGVIPLNGIIPRGMAYYDASVPFRTYNLFTAAEHLNRAETGDGDTWGERGFRITLYYEAGSGHSTSQYACADIKEGLEALSELDLVRGEIDVTVMALSGTDYQEMMLAHALPMVCLGSSAGYADPQSYMGLFVRSDGDSSDMLGIGNATLDAKVQDAAEEMNATARGRMYHDISMALQENCYYIGAMQETSFHVERTWVSGYQYSPMRAGIYFLDLSYASDDGNGSEDHLYAIMGIVGLLAVTVLISFIINKRLKG